MGSRKHIGAHGVRERASGDDEAVECALSLGDALYIGWVLRLNLSIAISGPQERDLQGKGTGRFAVRADFRGLHESQPARVRQAGERGVPGGTSHVLLGERDPVAIPNRDGMTDFDRPL